MRRQHLKNWHLHFVFISLFFISRDKFTMWEPNEQLLLRAAVRYKKHEGTLFVTPRRVAWQQQGSSQLTPSIYYNDIGSMYQPRFLLTRILLTLLANRPSSNTRIFAQSVAQDLSETASV